MSRETPLMEHWREMKSRNPGAILLYRLGEFYETFYEDAEIASRVLGLTLTSRNNGAAADVPLAGVPAKAMSGYLRQLVSQGYRVAICEQMEDAKNAKGTTVRREVVETITPGAAFADDLLDHTRNNFLCALNVIGAHAGIAAVDLSTGELRLIVCDAGDLEPFLARLAPSEMVLVRGESAPSMRGLAGEGPLVTERERWEFDPALASDALRQQFGVASLEAFGVGASDAPAVGAAGALLRYLHELQPQGVPHLARPVVERAGSAMPLDEMTRRNLELVESLRGGDRSGTLIDVLDRTATPMGARLLRSWILTPLTDRAPIDARLDAVGALLSDALARETLRTALDGVRDVERLASKAAAGRATPRELGALGASLARMPAVSGAARRVGSAGVIVELLVKWDDCAELSAELARGLVDRPPIAIGDEEAIRAGFDAELDEMRELQRGGRDAIARIQSAERARTGITSLKVGYNRVFGYFIEITNANKELVPADYQRRQTLAGAERYVTPELKEYEEKVLTAGERIEVRERALFDALRARAGAAIGRLQCAASILAQLDVLASLAEVAAREGYARPEMSEEFALHIVGGRHPVVERMMPRDKFIPNDVTLASDARMIILTGPNMAGKSTILRQIGLIVLMAQIGSFVPASSARIGIVDRVFTRVGASDNLVRGQSTFMVEMSETSAILHTATRRSLVLLDEIGRGTSTYDGVSIAWAVSEHLHDAIGCKTVFATHYHELTQLAEARDAIRNYTVAVREVGDEVLFLHTLIAGGADRSYGIEVGRLAGLPPAVVSRARVMLKLLEAEHHVVQPGAPSREPLAATEQLALFASLPHPVVEKLRGVDVDNLTPLKALQLLAELQRDANG
ncbi:MAG TPA: DNA mismatch repair protein MutS [Gemmatimonadaceae bacterium]|nr:DNA mismatch repair protein MutS [Gemmatimonadaceae bacterium]